MPAKWEEIDAFDEDSDQPFTRTFRLKVPEGWLYRVEVRRSRDKSVTLQFVPEPRG